MSEWFKVSNEASAEILITGDIGGGWTDNSGEAKTFIDALNKFPKDQKVTVGINSVGGACGDGLAIYNAIRRRGNVDTRVDGYALSAASFILAAGDRRIIPNSAIVMIHNASALAFGDHRLMEDSARMLRIHDKTIASIYADRAGKTDAEALKAMAAETWMTGEEAVAWGLGTEANDDEVKLDPIDNRVAAFFRRVPKPVLNLSGYHKGRHVFSLFSEGTPPQPKNQNHNMEQTLKVLVEAKLIPSAKLDDAEAATLTRASLASMTEKHTAELKAKDDEIKSLRDERDAARKAEAESVVAEAVKAGKIRDDATVRAAWVTSLLKDKESATAMLGGIEVRKVSAREPLDDDGGEDKDAEINRLRIEASKATDPIEAGRLTRRIKELRNGEKTSN